jgi:hypothetical protein
MIAADRMYPAPVDPEALKLAERVLRDLRDNHPLDLAIVQRLAERVLSAAGISSHANEAHRG